MRPMRADFLWVVFLLVWMLGSGKAVEFIQFDIFGYDVGDDFLIGGAGLLISALNPALDRGRMNTLNPGNGLRAQAFETLMEGSLDFLLRRLEVVEGRPIAVAESSPTLAAAKNDDILPA